jgi:uncharacterized protein YgbK (DUF1537 family)
VPVLTVVADDLTGACDAGTLFAGKAPVPVRVWPCVGGDEAVTVIDTETRRLGPEPAAARVRAAVARAPATRFFKKIDSTLRGRIGPEVEALLAATGTASALVCPAFPAQGRTVVERVLAVDGVPVAETPVAGDPDFPVPSPRSRRGVADVVDLLRPQFERPLAWIPLREVRGGAGELRARLQRLAGTVMVADAETDDDLDALVEAVLAATPSPLLVGAAGLARALAAPLGLLAEPIRLPQSHRWLVVAGSRHPVTRRQAAAARTAGLRVIAAPEPEDDPPAVARRIAAEARRALEHEAFDLVAVTGGETAAALWEALGADRLDLVGAPRPGLAFGYLRTPRYPELPVLTKAGGFGEPDLFVSLATEAVR